MLLKLSEKTNKNGWRRQIVVDFENKTFKAEAFQFLTGDIEGLTHKQYLHAIEYFKNNNFIEV